MKRALRKFINCLRNDERGTAYIELSVVTPVLLLICLGVFEFGNAIYSRHLIENGIRDAARYAAGLPANNATAIANAESIAKTGVLSGGSNRVSWWNPAHDGTCDNLPHSGKISVCYTPKADDGTNYCGTVATPGFCRGRDAAGNIYVVTVTTDTPYQGLGFMGYLGLGNLTMHVSHQERVFGVR